MLFLPFTPSSWWGHVGVINWICTYDNLHLLLPSLPFYYGIRGFQMEASNTIWILHKGIFCKVITI